MYRLASRFSQSHRLPASWLPSTRTYAGSAAKSMSKATSEPSGQKEQSATNGNSKDNVNVKHKAPKVLASSFSYHSDLRKFRESGTGLTGLLLRESPLGREAAEERDAPEPKSKHPQIQLDRIAAIVERRRSERLTREQANTQEPRGSATKTSTGQPRPVRNYERIQELKAQARDKSSPHRRPGSGKRNASKKPVRAVMVGGGRDVNEAEPEVTDESVRVELPSSEGPETVSRDLKDIFGVVSPETRTILTVARAVKRLANDPARARHLLRKFGGDYSAYVPQDAAAYTTPVPKLGSSTRLELAVARNKDISLSSREYLSKVVRKAVGEIPASTVATV